MGESKPPISYLNTCSQASLEAFELSRYNRAANLRKELRDVLDEWIQAEAEARLARWIREQRQVGSAETPQPVAPTTSRQEKLSGYASSPLLSSTQSPFANPFNPPRLFAEDSEGTFRSSCDLTRPFAGPADRPRHAGPHRAPAAKISQPEATPSSSAIRPKPHPVVDIRAPHRLWRARLSQVLSARQPPPVAAELSPPMKKAANDR